VVLRRPAGTHSQQCAQRRTRTGQVPHQRSSGQHARVRLRLQLWGWHAHEPAAPLQGVVNRPVTGSAGLSVYLSGRVVFVRTLRVENTCIVSSGFSDRFTHILARKVALSIVNFSCKYDMMCSPIDLNQVLRKTYGVSSVWF